MASVYNINARREVAIGNVDLDTDTLKVMLVDNTYVHSNTRDFVDDGGPNDPASKEISVTGYTGGFGGAGRKTIANVSVTKNTGANRVEFNFDPITWTTLGSGVTVGGAVLIKEVTNDTDSLIIAFDDGVADKATNGQDFTYTPASTGLLHF